MANRFQVSERTHRGVRPQQATPLQQALLTAHRPRPRAALHFSSRPLHTAALPHLTGPAHSLPAPGGGPSLPQPHPAGPAPLQQVLPPQPLLVPRARGTRCTGQAGGPRQKHTPGCQVLICKLGMRTMPPPLRHYEDQGARCVMKKGQTPGGSGGGGGRGA